MNLHVRDNENFLYGAHGAKVYLSGDQTIESGGTGEVLAFGAEEDDTDGYHDNTTNNSRITVPSGLDGRYIIIGEIAYSSHATGLRRAQIDRNGSRAALNLRDANAAGGTWIQVALIRSLAATDYVELRALQDSGSSLTATSGAFETKLMAYRLGN